MIKYKFIFTLVAAFFLIPEVYARKNPCQPFSLGKQRTDCLVNCKHNRCDEIWANQVSWCFSYCIKKFDKNGKKLKDPNQTKHEIKEEQEREMNKSPL